MAITTTKLFGSFGSFQTSTYLVFLASEALQIAPSDLIHCICHIVSLKSGYSVRQKSMLSGLTSVAQVRCCFIVLFPNNGQSIYSGFPPTQSFKRAHLFGRYRHVSTVRSQLPKELGSRLGIYVPSLSTGFPHP